VWGFDEGAVTALRKLEPEVETSTVKAGVMQKQFDVLLTASANVLTASQHTATQVLNDSAMPPNSYKIV